MRRWLIRIGIGLLVLAFLGQACASGSISPFPDRVRLPGPPDAAARDGSQGEYVLPTRQCGDFFLVDAWVNGVGPFPLLLDSGAGRTVLDPAVLAAADVVDAVHSCVGTSGIREGRCFERYFRDARAANVMAPTTDQLYDFIGKAICGLPVF